jgi:periplasmic protein CpxP/Spy
MLNFIDALIIKPFQLHYVECILIQNIMVMKKIGILLMSMLLVAVIGYAQPGQRNMNPEDMAKRQTEQIKEAVGLNEKQEKQVYDLSLETSKEMRAMREESQGGGFEGMREKMQEVREEQDKKMKEILTSAQWKKYEKFQEERRERMGNRQGRR